jgi:DNA-binding NtrC family response regulator
VKVLVIDDEPSLLKLLELSLKSPQNTVVLSETAAKGLEAFQHQIFDVVICDIGLPDGDGISVLHQMKEMRPETPVIMITAHGSIQTALDAMKAGAYDYVQKPFEPEELKIVINRALHEHKLTQEVARLQREVQTRYDFSNIIGRSPPMQDLFDRIQRAANAKSTVLISGESGTGKELIAKAIHYNSPRSKKPFVVVDCSSIPENLIESELFGHAKGAFTGADKAKKGLFEEANGGSLFLDEIGELPLEMQSKLLRVLQESTIRRVGETQTIPLDVRVIAATHRDLEGMITEQKFRQDLYYRLNVIPLRAPALRERREDILILIQHFLKKFNEINQRSISTLDPAVVERLQTFEWPGNVRQLENLMEQMVVMSQGPSITLKDLPPPLSLGAGAEVDPPVISSDSWDLKFTLERLTSYTEECMIRKALSHTQNNKTKAAELLGISRRSLIYKVQDYKIEPVNEAELKALENDPS